MYDRLQIVAFPTSYGKNTFANGFKGDYPENGWKVYDAEAELKRLVRRWRDVRGEKEERRGRRGERGEAESYMRVRRERE